MAAGKSGDLLGAVSVAVDRALGDNHSPETVQKAIEGVLAGLMSSRVHGDLTLEELCGQHDLLKSRFDDARGYTREDLTDHRLFVGETEMLEAVHAVLGLGVSIPKKVIVEKRDEFLLALLNHLHLSKRWSVRSALEGLHLCEKENSALRRNLAWVATQTEVTLETRLELSRRIRSWGSPHDVGSNSAEDEVAETNHYRRIAEKVCDLAQEAVEAGIREAPSLDDPRAVRADYEAHERGRVSYHWTQKMDALLGQLRPFTVSEAPPSGTLAEVRALTEGGRPRGS